MCVCVYIYNMWQVSPARAAPQIHTLTHTLTHTLSLTHNSLEKMESKRHPHGQPLADLFFGSWQQVLSSLEYLSLLAPPLKHQSRSPTCSWARGSRDSVYLLKWCKSTNTDAAAAAGLHQAAWSHHPEEPQYVWPALPSALCFRDRHVFFLFIYFLHPEEPPYVWPALLSVSVSVSESSVFGWRCVSVWWWLCVGV